MYLPLHPRPPFAFDASVTEPSHFATPIERHRPGEYWQTMRLGGRFLGVHMRDAGTVSQPRIDVHVFSEEPVPESALEEIAKELTWRFDLQADLQPFYNQFENDPLLGPVIERRRGMRVSAGFSLYEFLVIATVLQNCTVRRSESMLRSLLTAYGMQVEFDGASLSAFWEPSRLAEASEEELRTLKVGYRAKALQRTAQLFAEGKLDERQLRMLPKDELHNALLGIYGVGPASVWYLLFEVFHHYDGLDVISPWEQKIYSRLIYGEDGVDADRILADARERWGPWRMLAAHYLFEDLFARHAQSPIDWLAKEIRT